MDHISQHGEVRSGFEYGVEDDPNIDMECFADLVTPKTNYKSFDQKVNTKLNVISSVNEC